MRSLLVLLASGLFVIVLASCQGSGIDGSLASPTKANSSAQKPSFNFPALGCESQALCDSAVGEMISIGMSGPRTCLVSLVRNDLVLTASHCVPLENVTRNGEFKGGCWVRWPSRNGQPDEVIECARVVSASRLMSEREKEVQTDFAYISLRTPSTRPVLRVRSRPLPHSFFVRLYGVERPEGEANSANMRVLHERLCQHQPDLELMVKRVERGMAVFMPECPVRSGDSGSPLLDENGEIIGVLSFLDRSRGKRSWSATAVGSLVDDVPVR